MIKHKTVVAEIYNKLPPVQFTKKDLLNIISVIYIKTIKKILKKLIESQPEYLCFDCWNICTHYHRRNNNTDYTTMCLIDFLKLHVVCLLQHNRKCS